MSQSETHVTEAHTSSSTSARRLQATHSCTVKASREMVWKVLMDKIRAPEKYTGSRDVHIDADTPEYVDRRMTVGPPSDPMLIQERITWDATRGEVKFSTLNDPTKEGFVLNAIGSNEQGQTTLTFTFDWSFKPDAPDTLFQQLQTNLPNMAKQAVEKTAQFAEQMEEQQKSKKE